MDFKRKKKRGVSQKVRRVWTAPGGYRIVWRREAFGIQLPARFQACVRVMVPTCSEAGYREMWDFVNPRKHLYKTMNAAVTDCEKHFALWSKAAECTGIRAVCALFDRFPLGVPKSSRTKLDKRVFYTLMRNETGKKKEYYEDEDEIDSPSDEKVPEEMASATTKDESASPLPPVENIGAVKGTTSTDKGKKRGSAGTRTKKSTAGTRKSKQKSESKSRTPDKRDDTGVVATDSVKKRKPRSDKGKRRATETTTITTTITTGDSNGR